MVGFQLNTKVLMADNTYKNIQDIQINDSVMSWDENNQCLVPQTVVNTFSETCNELTIYTFDNGDILYGCEELIFLTTEGWKENIEIGDLVITKSGLPTALVDEEVLGSETVYELDIEDIDNYIVENIVVHNAANWGLEFYVYNNDGSVQYAYWLGSSPSNFGALAVTVNPSTKQISVSVSGTVLPSTDGFPYTPSNNCIGYSATQGSTTAEYTTGTTNLLPSRTNPITKWYEVLAAPVTNPPIYIGTDQISKIYIGSSEVDSVYIGTTKIY